MIQPALSHFHLFGQAVALACAEARLREEAELVAAVTVSGVDLFLAGGVGLRAGFPLGSGLLPVLVGDAVRFATRVEWERYLALCEAPGPGR